MILLNQIYFNEIQKIINYNIAINQIYIPLFLFLSNNYHFQSSFPQNFLQQKRKLNEKQLYLEERVKNIFNGKNRINNFKLNIKSINEINSLLFNEKIINNNINFDSNLSNININNNENINENFVDIYKNNINRNTNNEYKDVFNCINKNINNINNNFKNSSINKSTNIKSDNIAIKEDNSKKNKKKLIASKISLNEENNNEVKVLKNNKVVYINTHLLNSDSTSKNIKPLTKITFIRKNKRSSRYRGVSKNGNQWQVLFMFNKSKNYIGSYNSEEYAARIYDILVLKYRGVKARTNFIYNHEQIQMIKDMNIDIKSKNIDEFIEKLV